jgi:hypothetical protein
MSVRSTIVKSVFEMILVGVGVFLGMAADQWRTDQQHKTEAIEALRRFKVELENNRAAVANVKDYHVTLRGEIIKYLDPKVDRKTVSLRMSGIQPVTFEHTAWDLAIATQWLAEIDPKIAFELTRVYGMQQSYAAQTSGILQALYLRPPEGDLVAFLQSLKVYYDDVIGYEPALLERYAAVLPMIDSALRD